MDEKIPRLPRGRGIKLSRPDLFRIAMTLILLIAVIALTKPCANAVSNFVTSVDNRPQQPKYEHLRPGMTEEEVKAAIQRAKGSGSGVGSAP